MSKEPHYEVWKSQKDKHWYFHLQTSNGKIVFQSEGYTRRTGAMNGIKAIKNCFVAAREIRVRVHKLPKARKA